MVNISDGRFYLPDHFLYSQNQHVYVDKENKLLGIDQIGYAFLQNPTELAILVETEVEIGKPFAAITSSRGITTFTSPCSGKIKSINIEALKDMADDTYTKGHIIELESISKIQEFLISGDGITEWGNSEARSLLRNKYSFKVIEIGDSAVGKTALKVRFTDDYFKHDLKTTLGVDFGSKEIKGEYISGDILFSGTYRFTAKLNVWDAAGQTHYEKIRGMYYRNAKGIIMVYDVNNPLSFQNLKKWYDELEENLGTDIPVLLIGNKSDLEAKVSRHEGLAYAMEHNFIFVECSAKTGKNVEEAYYKLAVAIFKKEEDLK